jgi:mono/diheme cytochrome c family protein
MTPNRRLFSFAFATLTLLAACGGADDYESEDVASEPRAKAPAGPVDAKAQFESLCFTCHGATGHGDGPGAAILNPKPRSFADVAWQTSVTDDQIKKAIVFGGAAVGKSAMMPAQPQLKGNDALLDGLVQIVRGFQGK